MRKDAAKPFNLQKHYDQLYQESFRKFEAGAFELDPLIDANDDSRYGITLLFRPRQEVRQRIQQLILELQQPGFSCG